MSKDVLITELLALPPKEEREILVLLQEQLGEDAVLSADQEQELNRRLERFDREGSRGEPWDGVYAESSTPHNATN